MSSACAHLINEKYKIVANLPYGISSAFLKMFLTSKCQPQSITLLLQKEVAQRICAQPGSMSLLAVSVQLYGNPKIISQVLPESFWPKPKVTSAILQVTQIRPFPYADQVSEKMYWQMVRSGFSNKRKQLHNNLKNSLHLSAGQAQKILDQSGIKASQRAQELSLEDWLSLAQSYNQFLVDGSK